ncbi:MAG: tetratricopeptide repeat protein [Bacteroidia bacterium]
MKKIIQNIKTICAMMIFIIIASSVYAQPEETFRKANTFYQKEDYETAIKLYEQLIKDGKYSSEVYFNLGNSYYKTEKYESAILNYERAKKFNAADEDIDYNLRLANMQCVDKIEPLPQVFYQKWWGEFIHDSTPDERGKSSMIALWVATAFFLVFIFMRNITIKKICFYIGLTSVLVAGFYFLLGSKQNELINSRHDAIIFATSDYVKSSPDEKSANLFMLHSGTKVEVLDQLQGWKKIRIANGNVGWIPEKSIEMI